MNGDEPVRQRSLRTHNLGLVLRHVAASPKPVSRADVAGGTGLTKATVSTLVDELLGGGLLVEVAPPPRTGAGRPAVGLRLTTQGPAGLGLEVNVDYLAAAVLDLTGAQRQHTLRRSDQRGRSPEAVLDDLATLAGETVRAAAAEGLRVAGIAVAVPGLVADGVVRLAPNLDWRDVPLAAALTDRSATVGVPLDGRTLTVDNEANLAAVAELHAIAAPRPSFLYISGEIGVGAGIVLEGQLLRGARGYGGELGHVTIRPDGVPCRCGARGCLEAYANQEVLLRAAGLDPADPAEAMTRLVALARAGAHPALMALEDVGSALGVAAADVVNLLDLDTVVLGGSYAPLARWLIAPVTREITERTITSGWAPVTVRASALGTSATVVGAAGSVVGAIRDSPGTWLPHLTAYPKLRRRAAGRP
jgi:predicted NBD/HSP70 family sugar kinase